MITKERVADFKRYHKNGERLNKVDQGLLLEYVSKLEEHLNDFERGYFCAVASLLKKEGCITTSIHELFREGGNTSNADIEDLELFKAHGLVHNK